jgi:hypothetical protein
MHDTLPFTNQKYNDSIFKIAVYKLADQEPGLISMILDCIIYKSSVGATQALFKEVLPLSENTLLMSDIIIRYPYKKKVSYYWICKKLIQLLLWTEGKFSIDLDEIWGNYKINFVEISENILKIQQIISDYANHLTPKPALLGSDNSHPTESTILPSYQTAIVDRNNVGTSNSHLIPHVQQNRDFSETSGHFHGHYGNNPFSDNMLSYRFDGSDKLQARTFINDYFRLALRNSWTSGVKVKFFRNYLEKDALEWYSSYSIRSLTSWKDLKNEFARKYF